MWRDGKIEWLDYVESDVLCSTFRYASYSKALEDIIRFGIKDCQSSNGLGWKFFNSLGSEESELICTHNDKYEMVCLTKP